MNDQDTALIMRGQALILDEQALTTKQPTRAKWCSDHAAKLSNRADELDARRLAGADAVQVEEPK